MIGRPSTRDFIKIVDNNLLPNCPITSRDIRNAEIIFGPDVGTLKGKTVRRTGEQVEVNFSEIPTEIASELSDIVLCCDIMKVNQIPFLVSVSRRLKFGTIEMLKGEKARHIIPALKNALYVYT